MGRNLAGLIAVAMTVLVLGTAAAVESGASDGPGKGYHVIAEDKGPTAVRV